jgi:F-type H+-transporting ATPase subunit a
LEKTKKWRWGVNRWLVLLFIVLNILAVQFIIAPVQPTIQVAPEKLSPAPLFTLPAIGDFYLTDTLIAMLMGDLLIIAMALAVRYATRTGELVPGGVTGAVEMLIEAIYNLTETTAGRWAKKIFPWFATILILVAVANLLKLLPGVESIGFIEGAEKGGEPIKALGGNWYTLIKGVAQSGEGYHLIAWVRGASTDLNFTLALALISVFMTQIIGFQTQKFSYVLRFFNITNLFKKPFFGAIDFLVGLLETISEFAKILSFSFRLFGNMFAGLVLMALVGALIPVFIPSFIILFEFFVGLIQAFIFGMLTLVFMTQATRGHSSEEHIEEV